MNAKCQFDQTIAQLFAQELKGGLQQMYYEYVPEKQSVVGTLVKSVNNFILVHTVGINQTPFIFLSDHPLLKKFKSTAWPDFFAKLDEKKLIKKIMNLIPEKNWRELQHHKNDLWVFDVIEVGKTSKDTNGLVYSNSRLLLKPFNQLYHPSIFVNIQLQARVYKPPQQK